MRTPQPGEYSDFAKGYVELAKGLAGMEGDIIAAVERQNADAEKILRGIPDTRGGFAYAPEKWTLAQLLGHIIDAERIFAYRLLSVARGETQPLPGFEQDDYVKTAGSDRVPFHALVDEYLLVRGSTLAMMKNLPADAWERKGTASGKPVTTLGLAYIVAGHAEHHWRILKERYLSQRS